MRTAAERGIALEGLASFGRTEPRAQPALVFGYANLTEHAIHRGIVEIAKAIR